MYTNTNKKELQKIANYIYNITDTVIAIYDENKNYTDEVLKIYNFGK